MEPSTKTKKQLKHQLLVLDTNKVYPSNLFPACPGYDGSLYIGETILNPFRGHSEKERLEMFKKKSKKEWNDSIEELMSDYAQGDIPSQLVNFFDFSNADKINRAYVVLDFLNTQQIDLIVCLQQICDEEVSKYDMDEYVKAFKSIDVSVVHFPIKDHETPATTYIDDDQIHRKFDKKVATQMSMALQAGSNVYVHCKGGQGRSGQAVAGALCRMLHDCGKKLNANAVIDRVRSLRTGTFKHDHQTEFIDDLCQLISTGSIEERENAESVQELLKIAKKLQGKRKYEEALRNYERVLELNDANVSALFAKGCINFAQGDYATARDTFDKALEYSPDDAALWNNLGNCYHELGDSSMAIELYQEVLQIDPVNVTALSNYGEGLAALKKNDEAREYFDKALNLNPGHTTTHFKKGKLLKSLGKKKEAIASFDQTIYCNENYVSAYLQKGWLHYELKQYTKSIKTYKEVLDIAPENHLAWDAKGFVHYEMENVEEALVCFKMALAIKPDQKRYKEAVDSCLQALEEQDPVRATNF